MNHYFSQVARPPAAPVEHRGTCPLCSSENGPTVWTETAYSGRSCHCGTVYVDPAPAMHTIDPAHDFHLEAYYTLPAKLRLDWVQRFVPKGKFLDVGCGSGASVAEALARGFTVEAVEINATYAAAARRKYGIPVHVVSAELLDRQDFPEGFDVIFHIDLLSHFFDPTQTLRRMAALLRPGGLLCFEVGLFGALGPRWYPWLGRPGFPAHRQFYSLPALHTQLHLAGLEATAIRRYRIAASTILSAGLRRLFPTRVQSVPYVKQGAALGNRWQRSYAYLHFFLRYRIGAWLPLPGPATLLVTARKAQS